MRNRVPPRLRTPAKMLAGGAVCIVVAGAVYGWASALFLVPGVLVAAAGYYLWAGRDTDMGAVLRYQADERQAYRRLKIQALVGRVMSITVAVAYLVAVAVKATLWPFAILLFVPVLTLAAGWVIYREHDGSGDDMNFTHV